VSAAGTSLTINCTPSVSARAHSRVYTALPLARNMLVDTLTLDGNLKAETFNAPGVVRLRQFCRYGSVVCWYAYAAEKEAIHLCVDLLFI
jgi:hypothetical protein